MKQSSPTILLASVAALMLSSCSWLMQPQEEERVPQPPPGPEKSTLPHNKTQKFEAEAALGPLASPRR